MTQNIPLVVQQAYNKFLYRIVERIEKRFGYSNLTQNIHKSHIYMSTTSAVQLPNLVQNSDSYIFLSVVTCVTKKGMKQMQTILDEPFDYYNHFVLEDKS